MTDRFKRGSTPGRARSEDQRPGNYEGPQKARRASARHAQQILGRIQGPYPRGILEAASRVGMDAKGISGGLTDITRGLCVACSAA
jgi:hypothetical protein